jgi:phage recombination protein Bet
MTAIEKRTTALNQWDDEFRQLIVETILKPKNRPATMGELAMLAEQSVRTGLDPMSKQIYGIYRYDKRAGGEVMTIQVGIDGLRAVAERTGRYAGGPAYLFCGPDKTWTDVWDEKAKPIAAKAIVRKVIGGIVIDTEAVALWSEYGLDKNVWADKPAHMLGKCAEALALRKAFPQDLSGLYTDDEMGRADAQAATVAGTIGGGVLSDAAGTAPTPPTGAPADHIADAEVVADDDKTLTAAGRKKIAKAIADAGVDEKLILQSAGFGSLDDITTVSAAVKVRAELDRMVAA